MENDDDQRDNQAMTDKSREALIKSRQASQEASDALSGIKQRPMPNDGSNSNSEVFDAGKLHGEARQAEHELDEAKGKANKSEEQLGKEVKNSKPDPVSIAGYSPGDLAKAPIRPPEPNKDSRPEPNTAKAHEEARQTKQTIKQAKKLAKKTRKKTEKFEKKAQDNIASMKDAQKSLEQ